MADDDDLAGAAGAGLESVPAFEGGADQGQLDGTNFTKVKFGGVQYDTLDADPKIGDEITCKVRGRVVAVGDEQMADGHIRHSATVKVASVIMLDDAGDEIAPPVSE